MRKINCVLMAVSVLLCGCALQMPEAGTPTPFIITATLPPTAIPLATATSIPPTPAPTAIPVDGITSTQLNVRDQPSIDGTILGIIASAVRVKILGKDADGNWYQILYSQAATGKGWVTAQYVVVSNPDAIPVISASTSGMAPKGTETAAPIVAQSNEAAGTGTASSSLPAATPTYVAALQDNDSASTPAASTTFSASAARSLIYSSDVSIPDGDPEDWIEFAPYHTGVITSLVCTGNGVLKTELLAGGTVLQNWVGLSCGESKQLDLTVGQPYLMHISVVPDNSALEYVRYTLNVENAP